MAKESTAVARDEQAWQRKLLPFMAGSIAVMGAFFLIVSVALLFSLYREVRLQPGAADAASVADAGLPFEQQQFQTLVQLEQKVINHRYQQINVTLLLRAWTRYLGFLTGMILALVGAVFVLGKLREAGTTLNVEGNGVKAAISSSSPGLILAALGTLLMAITLVIPFQFDVRDVPVYLTSGAATSRPALPPLTTASERNAEERELFAAPELQSATPEQSGAGP